MILDRSLTNKANWILDNIIPPVLRDSKVFMGIWFRLMFGKKAKYFMGFKEKAPFLTREEYEHYYRILSDSHIQRETDLTCECVEKILLSIAGETVLDVGCGRGYLVRRIAAEKRIKTFGIDIAAPEEQDPAGLFSFVRQNIERLPFPEKAFDTVICTHTIEHLLNPLEAISEMRRVARKKIIIVVPRQREYRYTFDLHIRFFPYTFSLLMLMGNRDARCCVIGNDIWYEENRENQ